MNNIVQTIISEIEKNILPAAEQAVIKIIEQILAGGGVVGEHADKLREGLDELKSRHHGR